MAHLRKYECSAEALPSEVRIAESLLSAISACARRTFSGSRKHDRSEKWPPHRKGSLAKIDKLSSDLSLAGTNFQEVFHEYRKYLLLDPTI